MDKKIKIFLIFVWAVVTLLLPLAGLAVLLGFVLAYYKRASLTDTQKYAVYVLPAIGGFIIAWLVATTFADIRHTFSGNTAPLVWYSWLRLNTLHNPANTAGRVAFVVGAILTSAGTVFIANKRNRDSGVGIVRGKKVLAGGFATFEDIADKCDIGFIRQGQTGVPLGLMVNQLINVNPTKGKIKMAGHTLVIGATGTGKSFSYIRPQIIASALAGDSIVVTDPKGELFTDTANWLKAKGYDILLFNLANPAKSYRWNMITECKDMDEVMDLAEWMIMSAGDDEAFWSGGEVNLLAAALGYIKFAEQNALQTIGLSGRNIRSALRLLSFSQERINELITALSDNTDTDTVKEVWAGTEKLFSNYVEGVRNKLRIITKGSLADLTAESDFSLSTVGSSKTALFLILPEEGEYQALLVPFYAFMFRRLNELAFGTGGKLPYPTRFIMDEFANIGRVPDIDKVCALGRSKGIMVHIAVQNIGQLQGLYKRNNVWEAVVGNCPIKLCLGIDDINSARFFADIMGEAEIEEIGEYKDITTPIRRMQLTNKMRYTKETDTMHPYELLQLPEDDLVAILRGKKPLYLQKYGWINYPQAREIESADKTTPAEWELPARVQPEQPDTIQQPEQPTEPASVDGNPSTDETPDISPVEHAGIG